MSLIRIHSLRRVFTGLIISMGLCCVAISVKADQWGDWTYTVSGSNVTITGYAGTGGDVIIPNLISNIPVGIIGDNAFSNCTSLTSVDIPSTVANIGVSAFESCSNLKAVTIGTGLTNIGDRAFLNCNTYTNSGDSGGGTEYWWWVSIAAVTFRGDTPVLGSNVFDGDFDVTVYYYPWTSGWTGTFGGRPTVPLDISYVVNDGAVTITGYTGSNSFLPIPNTISNMPVVAIGDEAFYGSGITSVAFPESITSIGIWAFRNCHSLTNAPLPPNIVHVGYFAFGSCFGLSTIYIPASLVDLGSSAFDACTGLENISVSASNICYSGIDGVLFNKSLTTLIKCPSKKSGVYVIPASVTSIEGGAFYASEMESIVLPKNVTSLGASSTFGYSALRSIELPHRVESIGDHLFYGCMSLTNIIICGEVTETWTMALGNCPSLQSVYFKGNAPAANIMPFGVAFEQSTPTVYYYPWTSDWGASFEGRPTQINPDYTQWLLDNNFSTNDLSSTTNDFDIDGMLNWQEYLAGTSPTNDADKLAISFAGYGDGTNAAQISWLAKSNVSYQVMKSDDLLAGLNAWSNAPSGIGTNEQSFKTAPVDGVLEYADPEWAGTTNAFYRVNVVQ